MSLLRNVANTTIKCLNDVVGALTNDNTLKAIQYTAKAAAPLIVKGVRDILKTDYIPENDYISELSFKKQVALINDIDGAQVDLAPFEILNTVNTITKAINDLMDEVGEENVFIDELLIVYLINRFNVPPKYVDKVYRILKDNYAIENKCIRDGLKISKKGFKLKENELETEGGKKIIESKKEVDPNVINTIFDERVISKTQNSSKKIKKFVA